MTGLTSTMYAKLLTGRSSPELVVTPTATTTSGKCGSPAANQRFRQIWRGTSHSTIQVHSKWDCYVDSSSRVLFRSWLPIRNWSSTARLTAVEKSALHVLRMAPLPSSIPHEENRLRLTRAG